MRLNLFLLAGMTLFLCHFSHAMNKEQLGARICRQNCAGEKNQQKCFENCYAAHLRPNESHQRSHDNPKISGHSGTDHSDGGHRARRERNSRR